MQKTMKKIIQKNLIWVLIIGVGSVAFAAYMYNKPHKNIARAQPDYSLTSAEIYREFEETEPLANGRYLNKVVAVTGELNGVETNEKGDPVLVLEAGSVLGGVRCTMGTGQAQEITALQKGTEVQVKGICTGMLLDVILVQSILVQP